MYRSLIFPSPLIENWPKIFLRWKSKEGEIRGGEEEENIRKWGKKKKNKDIIPVRYIFLRTVHAGGDDFILRVGRTRFFCRPQIANCCTFYGRWSTSRPMLKVQSHLTSLRIIILFEKLAGNMRIYLIPSN